MKFVRYNRDLSNFVRYISEILLVKHAKPNQPAYFVRYNRVFVVNVMVFTLVVKTDCNFYIHRVHICALYKSAGKIDS